MQQNKDIINIEEVVKYSANSDILATTFNSVIGEFKLTKVNTILNKAKTRGFSGENIFKVLFVMVYLDLKNVRQLMLSGIGAKLNFKKDVLYDFLGNEFIDWRLVLTLFARQFLKIVNKKGDGSVITSPKCIVIDDSLFAKTGKKIETIGKLCDHCNLSKYPLGLRVLTAGFWDGKSFIPINLSIHNEPRKDKSRGLKPKELKAQFSKEREKGSPGFKRIEEVAIDKVEMAIMMVKNAIKNTFEPIYVLADSWFICEKFIKEIQDIRVKHVKKLHVIGLIKSNRTFIIKGRSIKAAAVPEVKRKEVHYCKSLKCHYIAQIVTHKEIVMKAFWIKMKGQEKWRILISTDTKLNFTTAMQHYNIRWSIEVFFKECKQNLNVTKCQSTDFDAQIAWITLSYINYIMLALRKRFDDYETFGGIFREFKEQLLERNIVEKLWVILIELYVNLFAELGVDWEIFIGKLIENRECINKIVNINFQFLFSLK